MFKMTQLTGNYHISLCLRGLCSYCLFVYVYSCVCMHACTHGGLTPPDVFPSHSLLNFLDRTLTEPGAHWSARVAIHQILKIFLSLNSQVLGLWVLVTGLCFLHWCWGSTLRSFIDHLPCPVSLWLKNLCPFYPGSHWVDLATQLSSHHPTKSPSSVWSCLVLFLLWR